MAISLSLFRLRVGFSPALPLSFFDSLSLTPPASLIINTLGLLLISSACVALFSPPILVLIACVHACAFACAPGMYFRRSTFLVIVVAADDSGVADLQLREYKSSFSSP